MTDIEALIEKYEGDMGSPEYITAARAELAALKADNDEMRAIEKACHARTHEATAAWQKEFGLYDRIPDLGVMIKWLMDGRAAQATTIKDLRKALDLAWQWIGDPVVEGALMVASLHGNAGTQRTRDLLAAARHEKDVALKDVGNV
jgi:hypothetical protein